jgi:hypothetical protein
LPSHLKSQLLRNPVLTPKPFPWANFCEREAFSLN